MMRCGVLLAFVAAMLLHSSFVSTATAQNGYNWKRFEQDDQQEERALEEAMALAKRNGILAPKFDERPPSTLNEFVSNYQETDPYIELFPAEFEPRVAQKSELTGYGLKLIKSDAAIIALPRPETPAERSGLRTASELVAVNGHAVTTDSYNDLVQALQSSSFDEFGFAVRDLEEGIKKHITVRKGTYEPKTAFLVSQFDMPVIRITDFSNGKTSREITDIFQSVTTTDPLVIDLRYATGGELESAVSSAQLLLGPNASLGMFVKRDGKETAFSTRPDNRPLHTGPLVILTSGDTESAAEFFLRAVTHNRSTIEIGERTAGKCFAQSTFKLSNGQHLRFSTAALFGPDRLSCAGDGIMPDFATDGLLTHATFELVRRAQKIVDGEK